MNCLSLEQTAKFFFFSRYATEVMDVRSSRLFCVQIFFTLLIPVLAVARFLLQAFLYKGGHIYGYMVSSFKANILYVSNFWDGENFVIQTFISRHVFGFGTRDQRWICIATNIACPCAVYCSCIEFQKTSQDNLLVLLISRAFVTLSR